MGGFQMKWKLTADSAATATNQVLKWKKKNHNTSHIRNMNLMTIMNLVRSSKVHRVDEKKVWKTLLKHRLDIENLKTISCLQEKHILDVIHKTGQDLNLINGSNILSWISDSDFAFGIDKALFFYFRE